MRHSLPRIIENSLSKLRRITPLLVLSVALFVAACGSAEPQVDPELLATGQALYGQHCAVCHGVNLEGQPNWKIPNTDGVYPAPPHNNDGHTWHHPDALLLEIIAQGSPMPKSTMPSFSDKLTQMEMQAILLYIKSFWGTEQLEFQREVTQNMQQ